jgi:hypothetical protein
MIAGDSLRGAARATLRRVRRNWRAVLLIGLATGVFTIVLLYLLATARPHWYQPAAIDYARLRDDKAALSALENQVSAALNAGREVRLHLTAEQVNRWIVARRELADIVPEVAADLPGAAEPVVTFEPGAIRIGVTAGEGGLRGVVSARFRPELRAGELAIRYESVRVGYAPVPRTAIAQILARLPVGRDLRVDPDEGVTLASDFVWWNGKQPCHVRELTVGAGTLEVVIAPGRAR